MHAGQLVIHKTTRQLGIITGTYVRTRAVGVMWAGDNYAVRMQREDLIPATFNSTNRTIHTEEGK